MKVNVKAADLKATGLDKSFALSEFPDLEFCDLTQWDDKLYKRRSVSASYAKTIEQEANKRGFLSRLFR